MQPYCGEQEEQQLLQVPKCTTPPSSPPGKAGVNKNYLPGISWRTVSEPVYLHIFILFRHPTLAAAEPEQKLWFNIDNLRKVSLCKWKEGEVVREKNFNLVAVLLWPQYSKCGTFLFSRKGTHSNALFFFPGDMIGWPPDLYRYCETKQTFFSPWWVFSFLTYTGTAKPDKHLRKGEFRFLLQSTLHWKAYRQLYNSITLSLLGWSSL